MRAAQRSALPWSVPIRLHLSDKTGRRDSDDLRMGLDRVKSVVARWGQALFRPALCRCYPQILISKEHLTQTERIHRPPRKGHYSLPEAGVLPSLAATTATRTSTCTTSSASSSASVPRPDRSRPILQASACGVIMVKAPCAGLYPFPSNGSSLPGAAKAQVNGVYELRATNPRFHRGSQ